MFQRTSASKIETILHLIFVEKDTRKKSITPSHFWRKRELSPWKIVGRKWSPFLQLYSTYTYIHIAYFLCTFPCQCHWSVSLHSCLYLESWKICLSHPLLVYVYCKWKGSEHSYIKSFLIRLSLSHQLPNNNTDWLLIKKAWP